MLRVESKEVKMWDKHIQTNAECSIKNGVFTCVQNDSSTFNSEIHKYGDVSLITKREMKFGEYYYNLAVYSDDLGKAWPLVTIPANLDGFVRRLYKNVFLIWTNNPKGENNPGMKQCSFCRLSPNEKVSSVTMDFNSVEDLLLLPNNYILVAYSQVLGGEIGVPQTTIHTLALYEPTGKMAKTFYEYYDTDEIKYKYKVDIEAMHINITNTKDKEGQVINIVDSCKMVYEETDL